MTARLLLVVLPLTMLAIMAASAFWVPSQDAISASNPQRAKSIVDTSIGDARTLNPILASDTSSARITSLVFDGLLRIDEQLQYKAALATHWRLQERVFITLAENQDAQRLAVELSQIIQHNDPQLLEQTVTIHPPTARQSELKLDDQAAAISLTINVPTRLEFVLSRVAPQLEQWFSAANYSPLGIAQSRSYIDAGDHVLTDQQVMQLLPAIEHNPQITFWLRKDVHFHDGQPFSAKDVLFTYQSIMDPINRSAIRSSFEPVKSVTIVDEHTVRILYKRLFSPAVNVWTVGILPEHLLNARALQQQMDDQSLSEQARKGFGLRKATFDRQPIGTGAFRFQGWSSDELIHLTRNDDYFQGAPLVENYYFRVIPDTLTQELEFRTGAADTYRAEPHQAARYREDPSYRVFSSTAPGYSYIGYNQRKAPFNDVRVRKALGMAIDVNAIIRYALFNEGARVTGPYASITHWYDSTVPALDYDPQAAKILLAQAGWTPDAQGWLSKDGKRLEFNLITNNGNLKRKAVASIVQQAWRQIGVKCNVQLFEWAVFLKDFINPGEFDAVILGWQLGLEADLYQIWHSSQTQPNQLNFVGFEDPQSDQLIEQFRREYDATKQREIAHDLHARIAELQPYTFLYAPRTTRLLHRKMAMLNTEGNLEAIRPAGDGDLFHFMNRWQHLSHDPGF